jgi:muramoyltetrapeptide carboxypeptidase
MLRPPRLEPGDLVRTIASTTDERELNDAFRDPEVRAIVVDTDATGAYRFAHRLDFDAVRRDPKPVIGLGQTTYLHLALWRECGLAGIYGSSADQLLTTSEPVILHSTSEDLSVDGQTRGVLIGGTLSALTRTVGAGLPTLDDTILLIDDTRTVGLGVIDRSLTHLLRSGALHAVRGIALGRFTGFDEYVDRGWTLADVLLDRLGSLNIPVLGGLPIGHPSSPVPIGVEATLDTRSGTLAVQSAVS